MHHEYCNTIEQVAAKQAELPYQSGLLQQIVSCADAVYDANQLGQIKTVLALNNLSFALLEACHGLGTIFLQTAACIYCKEH